MYVSVMFGGALHCNDHRLLGSFIPNFSSVQVCNFIQPLPILLVEHVAHCIHPHMPHIIRAVFKCDGGLCHSHP